MDREINFQKVYSKTRKFILKCNSRYTSSSREINFEKVYSKTRKFILKCNSRYASKIVGWSTRVKSAVHGKIFKTTSDTNLSAFSKNF